MADAARNWTDKKLARMENHIADIYKKASKGIYKNWNAFMQEASEKTAELQKEYDAAKQTGDKSLMRKTGIKLSRYKKQVTLQNEQYQEMLEGTAQKLADVNKIALAYVNDQLPSVYMQNFNELKNDVGDLGIRFDLVDESTVKRLVKDGDIELPFKKLDEAKDKRWNTKQINSSVLQGILQGESIDKIATRLTPIMNNNRASAVRNARTLITGSENRGRLDSYDNLTERGIVIKKVWIATGDSRTRDWHLEMDGQEVDIDENFVDGNGNELEYPGDPSAAPETVYNCRCTMISHVIGFRNEDGTIRRIEDTEEELSLHDQQIAKEVQRRREEASQKTPAHKVVDGQDISGTWERRHDQFDFEIEDVLNAQGFDGKPRVVSKEEFDRYVQEANGGNGFIAQRTYSAPDQETLDMYREQLYNGKWYVDCSTGGAQYGQGMYCAADYSGKLTDGIKEEMLHYQHLGNSRLDSLAKENAEQKVWSNALANATEEEKALIKREYLRNATNEERALARAWERNDIDGYLKAANKYADVATEAKNAYDSAKAFSYTETMTLDPSAKVVTYDDIFSEFQGIVSEKQKDKFASDYWLDALSGYTGDELVFAKYNAGGFHISWKEVSSSANNISNDRQNEIAEIVQGLKSDYYKKYTEYINETRNNSPYATGAFKDVGSYAAAKGYDAINAEGHGQSNSYTVVLNRTKLIILGE